MASEYEFCDTCFLNMMTTLERTNWWQNGRWLGLGLICLTAGCASQSKKGPAGYTFFPPPPDAPRIQFLTGFDAENDLGSKGKFSEFVLGQDTVHRPLWKPYGITTHSNQLYICDTQPANVTIVNPAKRTFRYIRPGDQKAAMKLPVGVAVDSDGTIYVTDTGRGQVLLYSQDGSLVGEIGKKDEMKPCGIAVTADRLYVTDLSNNCVRVYARATRDLLFKIPRQPDAKSKLFSPTNVAVDQQGRIYVSDTGGFSSKVYDAEGNHLRTTGELGIEPGRFALPKGIAVDRDNRMYVVDAATTVVQVFDSEGRLLMYFGEPKSSGPGGMYLPAGIAIDYEHIPFFEKFAAPGTQLEFIIFVTNQVGPQKVSAYGFLRQK